MKVREIINEATYPGNLGMMEMVRFQQLATKQQKSMMKRITDKNDWSAFRKLIHKVTGVKLH